jgi:hypothetical protein
MLYGMILCNSAIIYYHDHQKTSMQSISKKHKNTMAVLDAVSQKTLKFSAINRVSQKVRTVMVHH